MLLHKSPTACYNVSTYSYLIIYEYSLLSVNEQHSPCKMLVNVQYTKHELSNLVYSILKEY